MNIFSRVGLADESIVEPKLDFPAVRVNKDRALRCEAFLLTDGVDEDAVEVPIGVILLFFDSVVVLEIFHLFAVVAVEYSNLTLNGVEFAL